MIDHAIVGAFGNAPVQAARAIGVEGFATQVVMVRTDLGQGAAQRVTGHAHFRRIHAAVGARILQCPSGQRDGIIGLRIGPRQHH
ncbi:hypothetical protein D3C72_2114040 [compost metagenome]